MDAETKGETEADKEGMRHRQRETGRQGEGEGHKNE